jgi:CMP-N-acetylneuraminic acid synthetase
LGVILARAGSVGLKDKHLLALLGRPVIEYTFLHALAGKSLSRVAVSSDCPTVRKLAEKCFIETINRPTDLATGEATVQDVLLHAMHTVESRSAFRADAVVVLYGNVPVRNIAVIDRAVELLGKTGCDSVRSMCPVGKWHPSWMLKFTDETRVASLTPNSTDRRQDLEPRFLHDGAVVAVSRASLLRGEANPTDAHAFFGTDRRGVRTEMGDTIEIDHVRDLYWAEAVLRDRQQAPSGAVRMAS